MLKYKISTKFPLIGRLILAFEAARDAWRCHKVAQPLSNAYYSWLRNTEPFVVKTLIAMKENGPGVPYGFLRKRYINDEGRVRFFEDGDTIPEGYRLFVYDQIEKNNPASPPRPVMVNALPDKMYYADEGRTEWMTHAFDGTEWCKLSRAGKKKKKKK